MIAVDQPFVSAPGISDAPLVTILFSIALVLLAITLCLSHVRAYRLNDHGGLSDEDTLFFRRQYIRRLQTSRLLGIVGVMLLGERLKLDPIVGAVYWLLVVALVVWMVALAFADWTESRLYWARPIELSADQAARLKAEIERYRREQSESAADEEAGDSL